MKFVVENFDQIIVMSKGQILNREKKEIIFSAPDVLKASYVSPPPITRVGQILDLDQPVFNQQDFHRYFEEKRADKKRING